MNPPENKPGFGEYLVFVDESGDHGLQAVSQDYPVFVLLFTIIRKEAYISHLCPELQRFKFHFWGHDEVILHEHEIRKPRGHFSILREAETRQRFHERLSAFIESAPVTVVAILIDKPKYSAQYSNPVNPYDYAMEAGLERVFRHLLAIGQGETTTPIIVECRGKREDDELELAFRRVCDGANILRRKFSFELVMIPKASNSAGLQLADLMARPVGIHHIRPAQPNRAYEIIQVKFRRSPAGKVEGWGLKMIP